MSAKKNQIEKIYKIDVFKAILYIAENNLFALTPEENYLFDITDKRSPQLISSFSLNKADSINSLIGVVNKKGYFSIGYTDVQVLDFQNPKKPQSLGLIKNIEIGARSKLYEGRYLITNPTRPRVYEIKSPTELYSVFQFSEDMFDFIVLKNYLCVLSMVGGLKIYDLSETASPRQIFALNVKGVKLVANNSSTIFAQGVDDNIYVLDASNLPNITIITKIELPGPMAADSLICQNDFLFVRFMRKTVGDTTYAFDIHDINKPIKIFSFKSKGMPLYAANEKMLVLMGIKDWDGISAIKNYTTSFYKVFSVEQEKICHIGDIELEGIWFSTILALDRILYIARADGIYLYELKN